MMSTTLGQSLKTQSGESGVGEKSQGARVRRSEGADGISDCGLRKKKGTGYFSEEGQAVFFLGSLKTSQSLNSQSLFFDQTVYTFLSLTSGAPVQ